ncbi:uncharacterized protein LOC105184691 [Harpegnathos saltator]|uniref:CHK kinase-like domain-containing protein n=1 Tax=Harpegnathos saltator TaxID=610380 RepID=E2BN44_HARSA|nr:uncharacterized protein LOC105184691 [Harpegnathos saltator]EFN82948.1 hypothetical protein EAI_15904 [Harpegnathos saltator]
MSNTAIRRKEHLETETANVVENNVIRKWLSLEEVKKIVRNVLNYEVDSIEYNIRPYSDGKLGYLGSHYRLTVTATTRKKKKVTLPFFLKTLPYEIPVQVEYVINLGFFKVETMFYSTLMPILCEEYRGEPWAPVCYKMKENLLIFEELNGKGYTMRDKLFNKTLVRASLSTIAHLHAASLIAEARLGSPLNRLYPDVFSKRNFDKGYRVREWFDAGVDVATTVAERLGHNPDLIRAACEQVNNIFKTSCTKTNVVSHGDLWGNNLMFNNDVPPKCLLVDYQLTKYLPLAFDVSQFFYLCTDRSFRETWESAMLRHYYEILCETLDAHGIGLMQRPAWSEVVDGMEEQRLGSLITAIIYFPTVLMDEKLNAQIMSDPTSYNEFTFQNRTKFVLSVMEKDSVYGRRISEAVDELASLASRLDQLPQPS